MIDLTKLPPDDAERIAYAEGFTGVGALFARISDLEFTLQAIQEKEWVNIAPAEYPDVRYQRETYYAGIEWAQKRLQELNT
jgi:hypothetical protein